MKDVRIHGRYQRPLLPNEIYVNGTKVSLNDSLKVRNHSPDGFEWGYGGSGPSQAALAICLHLFDRNVAESLYMDFKMIFLASLPQGKDFAIKITGQDLAKFTRIHE